MTILTNKSGEPSVPASSITKLADRLNAAAAAAESLSAIVQHIEAVQRLLTDLLAPDVPALESFEIVAEDAAG